MKKFLMLFVVLYLTIPCMAQLPVETPRKLVPEWTYAEIIAKHIPTYKGTEVIIDTGQEIVKAWTYNYLKDSDGKKILFNSAIEALNYMTTQGWEFVQAYTSGEDNIYIHYLLRMRTENVDQKSDN